MSDSDNISGACGSVAGRFGGCVSLAYDRLIRPHLPRKVGVYSGVPVRQPRLLDVTDVDSNYKSDLLVALESEIRPGDEVNVIGAGYGVSSVVAAEATGKTGHITVYEAAKAWADRMGETMDLNQVPPDRYSVRHALVGPAVDVDGDMGEADRMHPNDLPECGVLEMDCEGAELGIIQNLAMSPRSIIVETHPSKNSPTSKVMAALSDQGYDPERVGDDPEDGAIVAARRCEEVLDCAE